MQPIQTLKSPSVYHQEILTALAGTGIRQTAPGGKARALADVIASVLGESEVNQFGMVTSTLLPYATGDVLDFLGSIYGVTRLPRQDGEVTTLDDNFQFYVKSGTFGSINNGQDIFVPPGVRIFTANANGPVYVTNFSTTLPSDGNSASFSAVSDQGGAAGIAPAGVFNRHNTRSLRPVGPKQPSRGHGDLKVSTELGRCIGLDRALSPARTYKPPQRADLKAG